MRGMTGRHGRVEALAFLTVILAIVGMFVSTPRMAGPDEPGHQSTAWYVTENGMPPKQESYFPVPGNVSDSICYAFDAANDASCLGPRQPLPPVDGRIFNYPPLYYWGVGLGQVAADSVGQMWLDVGGRVGSLLLNLAALLTLAVLVRRQSPQWGSLILLVSTPMAVFLWAVVNSSGWQISTGLLFAYIFAQAWWGTHPDLDTEKTRWRTALVVVAASVLFALARPDSLIWLVLIALSAILMGGGIGSLKGRLTILSAAGVGVLTGLMWQLTHPSQHPIVNPNPLADPQLPDYLRWFQQSLDLLPDRLRQAVGVLGWLDTGIPRWLFVFTLIAWAVFLGYLYARSSIPAPVVLVGVLSIFILPSLLEAVRWNDYPQWWMGRYTLTFLIPFLFLVLNRYASATPKAVERFSLFATVVLTLMVWQNAVRYAFGVRDYWPVDWADPAIGPIPFAASVVCVVAMAGIGIYRAILIRSSDHNHPSNANPDSA